MNNFVKGLNPVTSAEIFSRPNEFNHDGLFSERIFGNLESTERRKTFSYIDLYTKIIHPSALKIILQLNRKIDLFISASENFTLNANGDLIQDPDGELTGLSKFIEIFPDIKFRGETETREKFIKLLHKSYKEGTLFIDKIPIIPPDFRPAFQEEDGNWMIDKLNDVYQSMIRKAIQVRSSGGSGILFDLLSYGLQLAVVEHDKFIRTKVEKKNGLIRNQMLGKRIDFSGRAVITPGPGLKINEVGVPFRIAVNLFEPFIMHVLLYTNRINREELSSEIKKFIKTELSVDSVRRVIKAIAAGDKLPQKLHKIFWDVAELVMKNRVVICKRDPVLHMSSVRAFHPILVEGDTLQICVLQVGGFNADFDGDQMAIYTPLTDEAQEEVKTKMMRLEASDSSKSFVFALSKDMYAGLYLMTKNISYSRSPIVVSEKDLDDAVDPYIPVRYRGEVTTMGKAIFNSALPKDFPFVTDIVNKKIATKIISKLVEKYDNEIIIESVSKLSKMGFKFATIIAPTLTLDDVEVPKEIYELKEKLTGADTETADNILQQMKVILEKHLRNTGLHDLIESGAGKGWTQPLQILCAKGVIADTKGNILEPIKGSFAEGLTPIEFFKASPGARKGLADRVLNTATTGYMARKLS
jgi:DNA-directed RNA polymerase subunit beta'